MICVATVSEVIVMPLSVLSESAEQIARIHEIRIHFDGWTDQYDYVAGLDSDDLHPVGWCQMHGISLQSPGPRAEDWHAASSGEFQWRSYLKFVGASPAPTKLLGNHSNQSLQLPLDHRYLQFGRGHLSQSVPRNHSPAQGHLTEDTLATELEANIAEDHLVAEGPDTETKPATATILEPTATTKRRNDFERPAGENSKKFRKVFELQALLDLVLTFELVSGAETSTALAVHLDCESRWETSSLFTCGVERPSSDVAGQSSRDVFEWF